MQFIRTVQLPYGVVCSAEVSRDVEFFSTKNSFGFYFCQTTIQDGSKYVTT